MRKKDNKILITLAAAAAFAIAAAVGIYMMLSPRLTTFYTFKDSYKAGTVVTSSMLAPVEAPASIVVAGARTDGSAAFVTSSTVRQVLNRAEALKTDVTAGMPLMTSMLSVTGGSSIEMNMSPTKIAMTVKTDNVSGVTEELDAGSNVNVYVIVEGKSYLVFENMRLLAVSRDSGGGLTAATLELTNEEAELLLDAMAAGSIYFGLVNGSGYVYYEPEEELEAVLNSSNNPEEASTDAIPGGAAPEGALPDGVVPITQDDLTNGSITVDGVAVAEELPEDAEIAGTENIVSPAGTAAIEEVQIEGAGGAGDNTAIEEANNE